MNTQCISIDYGPKGYVIKGLVEVLPTVGVPILFIYLIKKSIHHGDISTLMITSQQEDAIRVLDFKTK